MSAIEKDALRPKLQMYFIQRLKFVNEAGHSNLKLLQTIEFILGVNDDAADNCHFLEDFPPSKFLGADIRHEFLRSFYSICLQQILANLTVAKEADTSIFEQIKSSILKIISHSNYSDSFNVIYDLCTTLKLVGF